jgi:hypothetical protein
VRIPTTNAKVRKDNPPIQLAIAAYVRISSKRAETKKNTAALSHTIPGIKKPKN